jgi:hypothetical protein
VRSFEVLISPYPREIQVLARNTREFLRNLLPGASEDVDSSGPYITYGYGAGYRGVVCYMTISKVGVKLGVANGATFADPRRLLEGRGKRHRHVPLASSSDLRKPGLKQLVRSVLKAHQGKKPVTDLPSRGRRRHRSAVGRGPDS